uniref:hypothetical protein n=1 Tax=Ningiella ruwaisensis TaxID=2364274 RepID=UPI0010A031A2|nr:hypothetical protein [Ningiella ruwaisensis]
MRARKKRISYLFISFVISLFMTSVHANGADFEAVLSDVAAAKICEQLDNRFREIEGLDTQGNSVISGTLWVADCVAQTNLQAPEKLTLNLQLEGWRWLNRNSSKLGADFKVNEVVRFTVKVIFEGAISSDYSAQDKIMYIRYHPYNEVQIDFKVAGDVDVDKQSVWSSFVSGAATMVGQSPDSIADERFDKIGEKRFKQKLEDGVSMAYSLCTGERIVELGQLDSNALKQALINRKESDVKPVALPSSSILLFGPYSSSSDHIDIVIESETHEPVETLFLCQNDAVKIARDYMQGNARSPIVPAALRSASDKYAKAFSNRNENDDCPVIGLLRTKSAQAAVVDFKFSVANRGKPEGFLRCE